MSRKILLVKLILPRRLIYRARKNISVAVDLRQLNIFYLAFSIFQSVVGKSNNITLSTYFPITITNYHFYLSNDCLIVSVLLEFQLQQ